MAVDENHPDWAQAPTDWNWLAQDEDGRWYWYRVQPQPGFGVWRAHSSAQAFACAGQPNPQWRDSLEQRPGVGSGNALE